MFKKYITALMVFTIFTVHASAVSHSGLKMAFDEMTYALSVEWDQKDQSFYEAQLKKFITTVRELQQSGLTNKQMIDFAKSEIKDAKVAKDLETAFSMITINKMSSEEASKYMMESMKRAYSNGASWNGNAILYLAVGLLLVGLAVRLSWNKSTVQPGTCYEDCYYYDYDCVSVRCSAYTCDRFCY